MEFVGVFLASIFFILFIYYCLKRWKETRNFPKGPRGLPLVGFTPFLGPSPGETFLKLTKSYGPIFSVQIGWKRWVVLNDYDMIKEALSKPRHVCSGRPKFHEFNLNPNEDQKGLAFTDYGPIWMGHRKSGETALKRFTSQKATETMIAEEVHCLCEAIEAYDGQAFNCLDVIGMATCNMVWRLLVGSRFPYDDKRVAGVAKRMIRSTVDPKKGILFRKMTLFPILRYFPGFGDTYGRAIEDKTFISGIIEDFISEQKENLDEKNPRGFIDEYLKQMDQKEGLEIGHLKHFIWDLIPPGISQVSCGLMWNILKLAESQECQERIRNEIENVIGDEEPSMDNQAEMPYTCAFIHEVMRHRTLAPSSVPHRTTTEVKFQGYVLPKNTPIIPNLWAVHRDPKHFLNPDEFRPERFIDDNNCFVPSPHVIPFSIGPRYCLGAQLARMETFLFLVGILQKFRIVADPEKPLPDFNNGIAAFFYRPLEFEVMFQPI